MKTLKHFFLSAIIIFIAFNSCKKIEHFNELPLVITGDTSNVQLTSATITGTVTPNNAPIKTSGHVWSSVNPLPSYSINEGKTTFSGLLPQNKVISNLTGLIPNKLYYVRGYAISRTDTLYGNPLTFSTLSFQLANILTGLVSNITLTSANAAGSIISIGNSPVTQYGHVWSNTNPNPTIVDSLTSLGPLSGPINYNSSLANLTPSTVYYVRAYAINSAGPIYGNVVTFTTLSNNPPAVVTGSVSNITLNTATAAGNITNIGSSAVTQYGHVWSSSNLTPTIADSRTQLGTAAAPLSFNSSLTVLIAGTIYYVRAYATNAGGTTYGAVVSFTTLPPPNIPSTVTTGGISSITITTASAAGNITDIGSSAVTQYGHVWSSTNNVPTINDSRTQLGTAAAPLSFISSLTGLTAGTTYYVRAYAINAGGTTYGAVVSFTTTPPPNIPPAVITGGISSITTTTAAAAGNITDIGSTTVTQYGHVWSSTNNVPTINDSRTQLGSAAATLSFNSSLTGLTAGTTYYVRAYATNAGGITYGSVVSFTTGAAPNNPPVVTTGSISSITTTSASAAGNITDIGSSTITQYGHVWSSINVTPTIADSRTQLGAAAAPLSFNSSLTVLTAGTTYYVRAYATNAGGTTYGAVVSFTTGAAPNIPPTVITGGISSITTTTAAAAGNITDVGSSAVTQYGHVWSSSNLTPTITDSRTQLGSAAVPLSFNSSLTGLTAGTTYYVRAYATNAGGTTYGAVVSFTTGAAPNIPPTVITGGISSITTTSASAAGNITDVGSSAVTQYGHVWSSTNVTPTIADSRTQLGAAASPLSFISSLTGLSASIIYYVRSYATNAGGTTYGAVVSFTTGAAPNNPPSVTTDSVRQITTNSSVAYGKITNIGSSAVTQHGHVWSNTNSLPTINDFKTQLGAANAPAGFSSSLAGLQVGTTYFVRSYAINSGGTSYGEGIIFNTQNFTLPVVEGIDVLNITQTTASARANIFSTGNSPVTQHGHVWSSTNALPGLSDTKTLLGPAGTIVFTSNLTGLQPGTTYYIRPYATNTAGTAFGTIVTFTTTAVVNNPPTVTTDSVRQVTPNTAVAYGKIVNGVAVTQHGHVWSSTTNAPTINDSRTQLGTVLQTPLGFNSSLTGLQPNTTYYVRSYAINNGGTSYGAVLTFTTTAYFFATVITGDPTYSQISSSITVPGFISSTGNSPVAQHGHVYSSTNTTPTLANIFNQLGPAAGTGSYNSIFPSTDFVFGINYYIRAYVTNSAGTSYGAVKILRRQF